MTTLAAPQDLERACAVLFGTRRPSFDELRRTPWQDTLRRAFRKRAFETHPDRARALGRDEALLAAEFRELERAYECVVTHLSSPPAVRKVVTSAPPPRPASPPPRASEPASGGPELFYKGPMPRRPLRFAEFLYYSGVASWQQLVAAIAWQRQQRPRVGDLAVRLGLLTRAEVEQLILRRLKDPRPMPFAQYAVQRGALTACERALLLKRQTTLQPLIGQYFVREGVVNGEQLEHLLHCAKQMNLALGKR
jgi:hypothetical protein